MPPSDASTHIAVTGIAGRMGQNIAREILNHADHMMLSTGFARKDSVFIGKDIGEVLHLGPIGITIAEDGSNLLQQSHVLIDFSHPSALGNHLDWCVKTQTALVLGTTGFSDTHMDQIKSAAKTIPVLYSANMSLGVAVVKQAVIQIAHTLGEEFDIEIVETHHRHKKDAPSGTALMLGEAAAQGLGVDLKENAVFERYGETGERIPGTIGLQTLRGGDVIGDHSVMFLGPSERIEITHKATNRDLFAKGAVRAALWLKDQNPGLYDLNDTLID